MPRFLTLTIAMVFAALTTASASGQQHRGRDGRSAFTAVGSILSVGGAASQRRLVRNRVARDAVAGDFLYVGDEISVLGQKAYVEVLLQGSSNSFEVDESRRRYVVPKLRPRSIPRRILGALSELIWPSTERTFISRSRTFHRGDEAVSRVARPVETVSRSPWLPDAIMILPTGFDHVTLTWCGDAGGGEMIGEGEPGNFADQGGFGRVENLMSQQISSISVLDRRDSKFRLDNTIRRVASSEIPRPDWLKGAEPSGSAELTAWGAWLLRDAGTQYHAFGLTLLDDAKFELPAAAQFFGAVVDCEATSS